MCIVACWSVEFVVFCSCCIRVLYLYSVVYVCMYLRDFCVHVVGAHLYALVHTSMHQQAFIVHELGFTVHAHVCASYTGI